MQDLQTQGGCMVCLRTSSYTGKCGLWIIVAVGFVFASDQKQLTADTHTEEIHSNLQYYLRESFCKEKIKIVTFYFMLCVDMKDSEYKI